MKTSKFYTEYGDSVILDWIKKYPHNLSLAFNGAAEQLPGRTLDGIRYHMRHRWNEAEDRTIARYIVLYDTPQAFRKYSEDFGVTEKSVASRYYRRKVYIKAVIDEILPSPFEPFKHSHKTSWFRRLWESVKNILGISKN